MKTKWPATLEDVQFASSILSSISLPEDKTKWSRIDKSIARAKSEIKKIKKSMILNKLMEPNPKESLK